MGEETFSFDPAHNILSKEHTALSTYQHQTENTLPKNVSKVMGNLLRHIAGSHFDYDQRGNLIKISASMRVSIRPAGLYSYRVSQSSPSMNLSRRPSASCSRYTGFVYVLFTLAMLKNWAQHPQLYVRG
nr:hypothetical protein [Taylorella equigenitalis]